MATNKNQHYVPKCHLKPFTLGGEGRAITLYNLDARRLIENAPVKNQCSRDNFYGKDQQLEAEIQALERAYSEVRNAVLAPRCVLSDEHRAALRRFWLMQHLRTEAASRRIFDMATNAQEFFDTDFRIQMREAVQLAMATYRKSPGTVDDMKICLLRNRTDVPFVTSDDPAILANRLHAQHAGVHDRTHSLVSAGALLLLPLSADVMCLGYDGNVYSIPHTRGSVDLRDDGDVDAFNQHQIINATANLYLRDIADEAYVARRTNDLWNRRPIARHRVKYMLVTERTARTERFQVVSRDEAEAYDGEVAISVQPVRIEPESWPRQIHLRPDAHAYSNGSVVGWVRRSQTWRRTARSFEKVRIR